MISCLNDTNLCTVYKFYLCTTLDLAVKKIVKFVKILHKKQTWKKAEILVYLTKQKYCSH